jgi:hypothetical protein
MDHPEPANLGVVKPLPGQMGVVSATPFGQNWGGMWLKATLIILFFIFLKKKSLKIFLKKNYIYGSHVSADMASKSKCPIFYCGEWESCGNDQTNKRD